MALITKQRFMVQGKVSHLAAAAIGHSMLAADLRGPGLMSTTQAPVPVPASGEVLLRMLAAGICGSDVKVLAAGRVLGTANLAGVSGHEFVGEVVASNATGISVGARVLALPPAANGFIEYLAVPAGVCIPVPDNLSSLVAVRAQQLGTVIHALRTVDSLLDRTVAIIGQGPAGLEFLMMARNMGARTIVTVEQRGARRAASGHFGADLVLDPSDVSAVARAEEITDGGPELVIDAAGGQRAIQLAYQMVRSSGTVLQFGLPDGAISMDHDFAFRKQVTTRRAVHAQREPNLACFRLAMALLARRTLPVDGLVSHRLPLRRLAEALELAANPASSALKVLIDAGIGDQEETNNAW